MEKKPTCNWIGTSGARYTYYIYELPTSFNPNQNGNYIYAKKNIKNKWVPVYIGQGDLADRSGPSHHRADCIKRKNATHFHCSLNPREADRIKEEKDLLSQYTNAFEPKGCNERTGG